MMHPDRFNQQSQKAEWDLANEMLKELNHAYGVLKEPAERSQYDRSIGGYTSQSGYSVPSPQQAYTQQPPPTPQPTPPRAQSAYTPPPQKSYKRTLGRIISQICEVISVAYKVIMTILVVVIMFTIVRGCFDEMTGSRSPRSNSGTTSTESERFDKEHDDLAPPTKKRPLPTPVENPVPADYPEPENGFVFKNTMSSGEGTLKISNGCNTHSVIKLIDKAKDRAVYAVFVRANSAFKITGIPNGTYRVLFAAGHGWDDLDAKFRNSAGSSEFENPLVYTTKERTTSEGVLNYYHNMELTLNPVVGGNAQTKELSNSEFEKY